MKKSWYDGGFPHKNNEPTVDNCINCRFSYGAPEGIRTPTLLAAEPKSAAYTNFATGAYSVFHQRRNRKTFPDMTVPESARFDNSCTSTFRETLCLQFVSNFSIVTGDCQSKSAGRSKMSTSDGVPGCLVVISAKCAPDFRDILCIYT